jgi:acetyl-CoA acetyltransferase
MRDVMREAVIVSAVRTPTGKFLGALKDFTAPSLGALVVAEAVARARIDAASVDECIMGNVLGAGLGQHPARQAALGGGLPHRTAALTINKVCGSGLKAVMLAAQGVAVGDVVGQAAVERRLTRRILALARGHDVPHEAFIHDAGIDAGPANRLGDDEGAEFRGAEALEGAQELSRWGADGADDD